MREFEQVRDAMRAFTEERGWSRFHDPKSLVLAATAEMGELAELLQWVAPTEQAIAIPEIRERLGEEISDVVFYLVRLADVCDLDLPRALDRKMKMNVAKHPSTSSGKRRG